MTDITDIFAERLARNRGPVLGKPDERQQPDYGVKAEIKGHRIDLTLTFREGSVYCCSEPGCHIHLEAERPWRWLREKLMEHSIFTPHPLRIRLHVVVRKGALFFDFTRRRPDTSRKNWYEFSPSDAMKYQLKIVEELPIDD